MVWRSLKNISNRSLDAVSKSKRLTGYKDLEDFGNQRLERGLSFVNNHLRRVDNY